MSGTSSYSPQTSRSACLLYTSDAADDLLCVDHFHPGVTQGTGDDLGAPVVAVETGLGDNNTNLSQDGSP